MADTEFVRVRECPDDSHPEGDGVWIASRMSLECGIEARRAIVAASKESGGDEDVMDGALIRRWFKVYALHAPVSWNLHDEKPWPFDPQRLVDDFDLGYPVADRADDLYRESVMRPLLQASQQTSRSGATGASTSPRTTSTGKRRRPSSRATTAGRPSLVPTE